MTKEIWINLPVKDINKSKKFFSSLGFRLNTQMGNSADSASLFIGEKNVVLMLFPENMFKGFTATDLADTSKGSEVLFSFDAESTEEVDELADKAVEAGGVLFSKPAFNQG